MQSWFLGALLAPTVLGSTCSANLCARCCGNVSSYNCSLPGLQLFAPGQYQGLQANYLSFATLTSSPNFLSRAEEFEACTGGSIVFAEAQNIWEDPIKDMGTKEQRGNDIYHAYFMSYSHFPEASALGLAESLEDRLAASNAELKWETTFPKVQQMGKYRTGSKSQLEFLMYDGDFFVPVIRLDLLERDQLPLPNTWREVLDLAHRYNGADLNEDGLPDFGMCHFPREGAGYFDWWWPELMYAIWATYAQVEDTSQGFLFDPKTLEPKLKGPAFQAAIDFMKEMWQDGSEGCISDSFSTGRCAIGFSPPGCWKGIFLNGVARRSSNGTVLWEPKMLDGSYAEPYRFKPFGTTQVEKDGILEECTPAMCPFAETIPLRGHHGNDDRARILPASPLAGKLINRAPFFWSGGLGIVIRKSAPKELKDMLWDWMVYTKRVETSAKDVASYASWLDSWRFTQLTPDGQYFLNAGWSEVAYQEHRSIMHWALGTDSNGAFNLRLPGAKTYTKTVLASAMELYISGAVQRDEVLERVENGWMAETQRRGILDQLAIYRAALGLTPMEDPELCQLHREAMDRVDPAVCRRFDPVTEFYLIALIALGSLLVAGTLCSCAIFVWHTNHAKKKLLKEKEANLDSTVTRGLATVSELGYPMAIISAQDFMKVTMEELASCHEGLRDIGYLRVLDTTEEISHFHDMGNVIVFFSYHWPSWERLGPDLQQRHAMDHSLTLAGAGWGGKRCVTMAFERFLET
ncbi:unnamed protein product [Durusdinium trenchii]|uniref:Uncharacterized protein n=1 Tax=Durusdinium trenchii TaxID=1381693 RepID=A0ABP0PIP5_9DINO